jgi:hypothetical protein
MIGLRNPKSNSTRGNWSPRTTHLSKPVADLRHNHQEESAACGETHELREDVSEWVLIRNFSKNGMVNVMSNGNSYAQDRLNWFSSSAS